MRAAAAQATGRGFYGGAVDVWALGCLAYELLTGESPFAAESESRTVRNILAANAALEKLESMAAARAFIKARRRCARACVRGRCAAPPPPGPPDARFGSRPHGTLIRAAAPRRLVDRYACGRPRNFA